MQKKENKGSQTENCSYIPTQTKKNPSPSEKSSTYKLKRGLNYTENREPELHLTNTYIQKKEKQNIKFPL